MAAKIDQAPIDLSRPRIRHPLPDLPSAATADALVLVQAVTDLARKVGGLSQLRQLVESLEKVLQ